MSKPELNEQELQRYSQQIKLAEIGIDGQLKLKSARVLCVGAGGLASPLLLYLAGAGVGTLGIIDNDLVELSNLQRQILYSSAKLGVSKVMEAQQKLSALNPDIDISIYSQRLSIENAAELIQQYDIIADCSDNFATRYLINDICYQLNKAFVSASVDRFQGQCAFFVPGEGPCYRCLFPKPPRAELIPNCEEGGVLGVLPGLLGVIQATEILKRLLAMGSPLMGRLLCFDALTLSFREFAFKQNPDCELCVHHKKAEDLLVASSCLSLPSISMMEFKKPGIADSYLLLDVRNREEHEEKNIGGILIPLSELEKRLNELDPGQEIVVYCRSGKRSQEAAKFLIEAGYPRVKYLEGGILAY